MEIKELVAMEHGHLARYTMLVTGRYENIKYAAKFMVFLCAFLLGIILAFLFVPLDIDFSYTVSWRG